jgi:hypothetical protein
MLHRLWTEPCRREFIHDAGFRIMTPYCIGGTEVSDEHTASIISACHRTGCLRSKSPGSCSGDASLESGSGHRIYNWGFSCVSSDPPAKFRNSTLIRPRQLLYKSLPLHQSLINLESTTYVLDTGTFSYTDKQKQTPWPLVRERTIPTDRPPLVDEI